jgi:hypothetical protein
MMDKRQPLQQMLLGKLDICMQKIETRSMSFTCISINSKWIKNLNIKHETLKLVQDPAGNTLELIGIGNDFLDRIQMAQKLREMIDILDYMKLKSFCTMTEMVTRLNSQSTESESILFVSYTSNKELITRIYKELKN